MCVIKAKKELEIFTLRELFEVDLFIISYFEFLCNDLQNIVSISLIWAYYHGQIIDFKTDVLFIILWFLLHAFIKADSNSSH